MLRALSLVLLFSMPFFCESTLCFAQHVPSKTDASKTNLILNGSFEVDTTAWRLFWSRSGTGSASIVDSDVHSGTHALQVHHAAENDWSVDAVEPLSVTPGEIYQLSGWVKVQGSGSVTLAVALRNEHDEVLDWSYGRQASKATESWKYLVSRFVVPRGATTIVPRMMGVGSAEVTVDDLRLVADGDVPALREPPTDDVWTIRNDRVEIAVHFADASFRMLNRHTGRVWRTMPSETVVLTAGQQLSQSLRLNWLDTRTLVQGTMTIGVVADSPEVKMTLHGEGGVSESVAYPSALQTESGMNLILPVNEGISYPVDDDTIDPMQFILYGGHGLCMSWYGVTAGDEGVMTIVDTPDDASVRVPRVDGRLTVAPIWDAQKTHFGSDRQWTYVLVDEGGYVAMCKRFRRLRTEQGWLKTLSQKRAENSDVDMLVGAVNVWCWDHDSVGICQRLMAAGIDRILWSHRGTPESLEELNEMGVLTSRYDIFQDAMNPANFSKLNGLHPDWTSEGWPHDLMIDGAGQWIRGWGVTGKDGSMYPCGVLCDARAVKYAKQRIPAELLTHPYHSRFIDTTTASPWRECYDERHPLTRSESRQAKMELLQYISEGCHLVTGSETGHEAAVPYVHYFEGMLSLGPYRVPDSGRNMQNIVTEVPPRVAKFQTGHFYRLPLWELVYHDCVVAQWYWGDYNNKLPSLWTRRDLWNALYGTPPMFMFNAKLLDQKIDRFVESYHTAATVARSAGYSEMLSHEWLTEDHAVQQTRFANGETVTVNFGDTAFTMDDGTLLEPLSHVVSKGP
ncbi:Carbohydrate binding domain protein [Planctomycetes bacterium CA13]|uniref:Carbohydrate binding domain protein n=1 Tax=Novipirellula herctigrandis TaxID=2527986 RepID=A0A5C5YZP5_9BACT|nr:Carbohydrate binding domain protein [Planctomycetes bacterium CA13]